MVTNCAPTRRIYQWLQCRISTLQEARSDVRKGGPWIPLLVRSTRFAGPMAGSVLVVEPRAASLPATAPPPRCPNPGMVFAQFSRAHLTTAPSRPPQDPIFQLLGNSLRSFSCKINRCSLALPAHTTACPSQLAPHPESALPEFSAPPSPTSLSFTQSTPHAPLLPLLACLVSCACPPRSQRTPKAVLLH